MKKAILILFVTIALASCSQGSAAYTLDLPEYFSIGSAADKGLAESLNRRSLTARGHSSALVRMTLPSAYSDQNTDSWTCEVCKPQIRRSVTEVMSVAKGVWLAVASWSGSWISLRVCIPDRWRLAGDMGWETKPE